MKHVTPELKEIIIKEHLETGRTYRSLSEEYGYSIGVISGWIKKYRKECQENKYKNENLALMEENLRLRRELEEAKKEGEFLKKAAAFFAKGNG